MAPGLDTTKSQKIRQACDALFSPGQVVELRVLGINHKDGANASGWFNDFDKLTECAVRYDAKNPLGIYTTLGEVHAGCIARSNNQIQERTKVTTSDKDILTRHWFPVDIDPTRPSGVSSTDNELRLAQEMADEVQRWLKEEHGFNDALRANSGNGVHLLYRVLMPNEDRYKLLFSKAMAAVSNQFTNDQVGIDTGNFNAARIFRLYGTTARKGLDLEGERPHRQSELVFEGDPPTFDSMRATPLETIAKLVSGRSAAAAALPNSKRTRNHEDPDKKLFDLDAFIKKYGITVVRIEPIGSKGAKYILDHCVFDSSHTGTSAALGRGETGAIFYKCFHNSCTEKGWQEVRDKFGDSKKSRAGRRKRSDITERTDDSNPWTLAQLLIEELYTDECTGQVHIRRQGEVFYTYRPTKRCYVEVSDDEIRMGITRWLGDMTEKLSQRQVNEVYRALCARVTVTSEIEIPFMSRVNQEEGCTTGDPRRRNYVTLKNGILDLDLVVEDRPPDECLLTHTAEWLTLNALPFGYPTTDRDAQCPSWHRFLNQIMEGDAQRIDIIQEAFGYCLMPSTFLEKFFVLSGVGRNGKSTLLNVLRHMLGPDNVDSLTPEQLGDRYLVARLQSKFANLCADMSEIQRTQEGMLKSIVSGEPIISDRKYKDAVQIRPRAKLFFAANLLPRFGDTSLGMWRRMILLPFNYIVPLDKVDVHLFAKLQKEMPGILLWAIGGMVRLCSQKRFSASGICAKGVRDYRMQCFPILTFLEECTDGEGEATTRELWTAYKKWCKACGLIKPKPMHAFARDVVMFRSAVQRRQTGSENAGNVRFFGISLKPNLDIDVISEGGTASESYGW